MFEQDPVKYLRYEQAIALALQDIHTLLLTSHAPNDMGDTANDIDTNTDTDGSGGMDTDRDGSNHSLPPTATATSTSTSPTIVVMVVGAGRGPLVQAALSASCSTGIPIRVFAVEKNTNAVITLRNRCVTESWSNVGKYVNQWMDER